MKGTFTNVIFERKIGADGDFVTVLKIRIFISGGEEDGIYYYRALISDSAGNFDRTDILEYELETVVPIIKDNTFTLGEDDTGRSNNDFFTKVKKPTIELSSEPNLRIFLNSSTSSSELNSDQISDNLINYNEETGIYIISLDSELSMMEFIILLSKMMLETTQKLVKIKPLL